MHPSHPTRAYHVIASIGSAAAMALAAPSLAQVATVPTMDPSALAAALQSTGVTITSISVASGVPGQFGTYSNFTIPPVTIQPGIVLSSGSVFNLAPFPEATQPGYDPSGPPEQVNSQMVMDPDSGGTPEFEEYGSKVGHIENFNGSFDVAALRVEFTLDAPSPVKFDFIFGSVEYPYWTSQFTDAFLVFLDGTDPSDQVCYDSAGNAIQVGSSFAGFETTGDQNTAFSNPHGVIHHLTTTTAELSAGEHVLYFEVGDVNDHILDSAVFISRLRAESGNEGTEPTDDDLCPADFNKDGSVDGADLGIFLSEWNTDEDDQDLNDDGVVNGGDLGLLLSAWGDCPPVHP